MSDKAKNRIETPEIFTTGLTNNRFFSPTLQVSVIYFFYIQTKSKTMMMNKQTRKPKLKQKKERCSKFFFLEIFW